MFLPWFLLPKLVAGKAENGESKKFHLFVQCIQFTILVGVSSVGGHVDEEDTLAPVVTEVHSAVV